MAIRCRFSHLKDEAIRLRREAGLTYAEIGKRLGGIPKATLSLWLSDKRQGQPTKARNEHLLGNKHAKKEQLPISGFAKNVDVSKLSRRQKMKIAESAVLFRLAVFGFEVYKAQFDGDRVDWLVDVGDGALRRIQVRWAAAKRGAGLPCFSLMCANGARTFRRLSSNEFDFIVGYDFLADVAYVFSAVEVESFRTRVTVKPLAAEQWNKLRCAVDAPEEGRSLGMGDSVGSTPIDGSNRYLGTPPS